MKKAYNNSVTPNRDAIWSIFYVFNRRPISVHRRDEGVNNEIVIDYRVQIHWFIKY
jgi:hypothetical protein